MKIALIVLIIFTLLIVGCSNPDVSPEDEINTDLETDQELEADTEPEVEADTEEELAVDQCADLDCFEAQFQACQENATIATSDFGGAVYRYTIIGPKSGGCEVLSVYETNPDPLWEGKEMLCRLDTNLDFRTAIMTFADCEGELYELLNS